MHFIFVEGHVQHDANRFRPVSLMLHLGVGNDDCEIGLVPRRKHAEQAGFP